MAIRELRFPFAPGPLGEPPAEYAELRESELLAEVVLPSGDLALLVTRYEDARATAVDPRFSRNLRFPGAPRVLAEGDMQQVPDALVNMDHPEHTRVRRIVQEGFTPRTVASWRPRVRAIAAELVGQMLRGTPPADLCDAVAFPLPMQVILRLLGVTEQDVPLFRDWAQALLSTTAAAAGRRRSASEEFTAYVRGLVSERREQPGKDLVDDLIAARDNDERLSEPELVSIIRTLILAGHETTATVISRGTLALLRHRDQYAELCADPGLLPGAVEEILRVSSPEQAGMLRLATADITLPSGRVVPLDRAVLAPATAANRDPRCFRDPERFDIHRDDGPHLTFGQGPHFCLGAGLARIELHAVFEALTARAPGLRLAGRPEEVEWVSGSRVVRPRYLPVTW